MTRLITLQSNRDGMAISSPSNSKVKIMKTLSNKKKRDQLGLVYLEGFRHVEEALNSGLKPRTIFMTQSAIESKLGGSNNQFLII